MELKFERQAYQTDAIAAVVDLFQGEQNQAQAFDLQADNYSPAVANIRR